MRFAIALASLWLLGRLVYSLLTPKEQLYGALQRDVIPEVTIERYQVAAMVSSQGEGLIQDEQTLRTERDLPDIAFNKEIFRKSYLPPNRELLLRDFSLEQIDPQGIPRALELQITESPVTIDLAVKDQEKNFLRQGVSSFRSSFTASNLGERRDGRLFLDWNVLGMTYLVTIQQLVGTLYLPRGVEPPLVNIRSVVFGVNEVGRDKKIEGAVNGVDSGSLRFEIGEKGGAATDNRYISFTSTRAIVPGEVILILADWPLIAEAPPVVSNESLEP
jgi:hypothetical protein